MKDDSLEFSYEGKIAKYVFLSRDYDINIFIEDFNKVFEYEEIIHQLFKGESLSVKIYDMNGKPTLIDAYDDIVESDLIPYDDKKVVFLADRDFDHILSNVRVINHPSFIYLNSYNIENTFVEKDSVELLACGFLKKERKEIESLFKFSEWKDEVCSAGEKLFLGYCFIQEYYPDIPTISNKIGEVIDYKNGRFRADVDIDDYIQSKIYPNCIEVSQYSLLKNKYQQFHSDPFNFICGKFLLESLYCHFQNICNARISKDQFRWNLICGYNPKRLRYVKDQIKFVIENGL